MRQMAGVFHQTDVDAVQAAVSAAQGNRTAKLGIQVCRNYEKTAEFYRLALPGIRSVIVRRCVVGC